MESPDLYLLRQINWQLYVTLTLDPLNVKKPFDLLAPVVHFWHHKIGQFAKQSKNYVPAFFASQEDGEKNGRAHFHSCVAGLPESFVHSIHFRMACRDIWPCGIAEVREYVPELDGIGYITPSYWHAEANKYETAKMCNDMDRVVTSKNFWKLLAKIRGVEWQEQAGRLERDTVARPIARGDSLRHPAASYIIKV